MASSVSREEVYSFVVDQVQMEADDIATAEGRDIVQVEGSTDVLEVLDSLASLQVVFEIESEFFADRPAAKVEIRGLESITIDQVVDMVMKELEETSVVEGSDASWEEKAKAQIMAANKAAEEGRE